MAKKKQDEKEELVEEPAAEVVVEAAPVVEPKVEFDAWYALRGPKIPAIHHKEILQADFKGRGLKQHETMQVFDAALAKYGVKLE